MSSCRCLVGILWLLADSAAVFGVWSDFLRGAGLWGLVDVVRLTAAHSFPLVGWVINAILCTASTAPCLGLLLFRHAGASCKGLNEAAC